jgi:hypothetical protein
LTLAACGNNSAHNGAHQSDTTRQTLAASATNFANNDTLIVDRQAAVFIEPDSIRIEREKKQSSEEDFYTAADDYLYYLSSVNKFLDSVKLRKLYTTDKKYIKFISNDKSEQLIKIDELPQLWSIYFFDPRKKAKDIDMTMVWEEYEEYYSKK